MATKIGLQLQNLSATNPWWRDANWHASDPDLQEAKDHEIQYNSGALTNLAPGCLYILRGPRRVGKTVAVKQAIKELLEQNIPAHCIVRLSTDGWSLDELRELIWNVTLPTMPEGARRYWFIDEISAIKGGWDHVIKDLRDENPEFRAATVVLTGSNAAALTDAAGTLAGRRGKALDVERTLLPIGFASFVELIEDGQQPPKPLIPVGDFRTPAAAKAFTDLIPWTNVLVKHWETYVLYGGFPAVVAAAKNGIPIPPDFINTMFDVVQKDALRTTRLDENTSTSLQEKIWLRMSVPIVPANIATELQIGREVVVRHLEHLTDSFLVWDCEKKQAARWTPQAGARRKVYAVDPLVARLPHLRDSQRQDIDLTILTEMMVGMALRRRVIRDFNKSSAGGFIYYFTSKTRKEIDFVSQYLGDAALEGKYTQGSGWKTEAATVNASQWDGILTTRNVLDVTGPDAWAVPTAFLCYLLDT